MMNCPTCGSPTYVIDSRPASDDSGPYIRRRRACSIHKEHLRLTTQEREVAEDTAYDKFYAPKSRRTIEAIRSLAIIAVADSRELQPHRWKHLCALLGILPRYACERAKLSSEFITEACAGGGFTDDSAGIMEATLAELAREVIREGLPNSDSEPTSGVDS